MALILPATKVTEETSSTCATSFCSTPGGRAELHFSFIYMLVLLLRHCRELWPGTRWSLRRHRKFELNSLLSRAVKIAEFAIKFPTKAIIYNVCFIGMNIKVYGMKV